MAEITLDISFLNTPVWQVCTNHKFVTRDDTADIWRISVHKNLYPLDSLSTILHRDEIARANRYLRKEDHDRFIISRASLRHILSKYTGKEPEVIVFELEPNRKPYIPGADIQYNLSDSGDQILIAVARTPVGVDVEYIKPKFYYDTILPLNFNQAEINFINETDSSHRFYTLWTRKEAILKATGIGLTDRLKQIPSLDGKTMIDGELISTQSNWKLRSFMTSDDYMATIATNTEITNYNFYEFNHEELLN